MRIIPVTVATAAILALAACSPATTATSEPPASSPAAATSAPEPPAPSPSPPATSSAPEPEPGAPQTATEWAEAIRQETTTKIVTITEDNDPNDLIGRPNGYTDAAVIYDKGAKCDELGSACGATVEIWPSDSDAKDRSDYIQSILKENPAFGTEYHTLAGPVLLRVTGKLKPSVAEAYAAAFTAAAG